MHSSDSNMKKKNHREVVVEAAGVVEAEVVVEELTIMDVLRSRTVKVLTLTSTFLRSTTWYMRSIRNLYLRCTLIIMKIPEEAEVVVEAVAVLVVIIMMRVRIHVPKLHPLTIKRKARITFKH